MAHLQYMPGDPRLVDQLVYELKSKGIFDQFRKDCIADVDTRPAYQNLRQRVESSVSTFLSRQCWQPDLNKNQLREKLRKHILDGNYLEQGVERIVDQVVNPKVASVFIPQVEDLVYNYLGITRKKSVATAEASNEKVEDLLPTDLEAVSPGSVKSNDGDDDKMDIDSSVTDETKMEMDEHQTEVKDESTAPVIENHDVDEKVAELANKKEIAQNSHKSDIPLPSEDIKVENIPPPENSPPKVDLAKIELPKVSADIPLPDSIVASSDIPLPDEIPKDAKDEYFKTINSDEDESSSDSSLRRNMSPLTPIRNFNNENSCDAQQAFENDLGNSKDKEAKEPNTFRFAIENKSPEKEESMKMEKKEIEQVNLSYQFNHQVNINNFNTPLYEDSSNSNNLQIDYESDANSKAILEVKANEEQSLDGSKKDRKTEDKKSSHKSSHRSRDSSKYSSSKDKRSDSKASSSRDRDSSRHDKKFSKDDSKSKSSHKDRSSDKSDKKDSDKKERDSSRHRSSHKSSSHRDSKSHKSSSSSSSQRRSSSSKNSDEKKSSSSSNHKEKSEKSERSSDKSSRDRSSKDSKSSSHRSDKDRKSSSSKSSSKHDEKDKEKKSKKETDDHYGLSGRGNSTRRSTDRDSNDGSSSSKGSHNPSSSKSSSSQKDSKGSTSKSDNTSPSGESTSPSDKEHVLKETKKSNIDKVQPKPIVRIDTRLELPMASPPRLPFVPDVTIRKPKIAANLEEAKKLMKMRRFLDEEQKRMNQEAALLLEFQANVRPSLSQVYSSIPGPELEFACVINNDQTPVSQNNPALGDSLQQNESILISNPTNALLAVVNAQNIEDITDVDPELCNSTDINGSKEQNNHSINESELTKKSETNKEETKSDSEQSNVQTHEDTVEIHDVAEARIPDVGCDAVEMKEIVGAGDDTITIPDDDDSIANKSQSAAELDTENEKNKSGKEDDNMTEYFEITVIAEELSESEETQNTVMKDFGTDNQTDENVRAETDLSLNNNNTVIKKSEHTANEQCLPDEPNLKYFTNSEKYNAELDKEKFERFFKSYTKLHSNNKIYLINCDSYEESIMKDVLESLGSFDVVNYQRNGHLKLPKAKSIVKNVNVASEVSLPFDNNEFEAAANELEMDLKVTRQTVLSPVKSECSFELSNDYDAKIDEMVNNASRQEIMEIILGNAMSDESPSKMPKIDYVSECNIESEVKSDQSKTSVKRKLTEVETTVNNNRPVLTPRKLRKMSASDQITSTTEESDPPPNIAVPNNTRSKYLGRARRVGLPKPRKSDQPNSPSSDKSVENYEQNNKTTTVLPPAPNGKIKTPQRNKIQRYDTSDLYKPKLHYLSRRNNIN